MPHTQHAQEVFTISAHTGILYYLCQRHSTQKELFTGNVIDTAHKGMTTPPAKEERSGILISEAV